MTEQEKSDINKRINDTRNSVVIAIIFSFLAMTISFICLFIQCDTRDNMTKSIDYIENRIGFVERKSSELINQLQYLNREVDRNSKNTTFDRMKERKELLLFYKKLFTEDEWNSAYERMIAKEHVRIHSDLNSRQTPYVSN